MKENISNTYEYGKLMMPDGNWYSCDSRTTGLNNNMVVVGPSGAGKSTVMGVLNALNSNGSLVISDPKGTLYRMLKDILSSMGYKVEKLDLTHPENSSHYNPLVNVKNTQDIRKLAHSIVFAPKDGVLALSKDPYWDNSAESLLCAFISYVFESGMTEKSRNLTTVMDMLCNVEIVEDLEEREDQPIFKMFKNLERKKLIEGSKSWAAKMFKPFRGLSEKTLSCVISTLTSILTAFEGDGIADLFSDNDFDLAGIGKEKTAVFIIVSDTDRSCDLLANMFYSQAMNALCDYADNCCQDGKLPIPVTFILDDFATNCRIDNFQNIISNIRARNISAIIMLQSLNQLSLGYGDGSQTILNNCDTVVFMGANSIGDSSYFAERANKPVHVMLEMPLFTSWIFRRCDKPKFVANLDPRNYLEDFKQQFQLKKQDSVSKAADVTV